MKHKKAKTRARKGKPIRQVGALPYRRNAAGELQFMLITSRGTQRFVFPKGWTMKGKSNRRAAMLETAQEAGVAGRATSKPFGEYSYWKRLKSAFVPVTVIVFPIEIDTELADWRESEERQRSWVSWKQARALIDEPELVTLLDAFVEGAMAAEADTPV